MSTTISEVGSSQSLAHKDLIDPRLWQRLVPRVLAEHEFQSFFGSKPETEQHEWAERIVNEALGYLKLCGERPGESYGPSALVDIGWHTFILYTREYGAFCETIAGRFIHHGPSDEVDIVYDEDIVPRTIAAMQSHDIAVDLEVWSGAAAARCSSHCKNTCSHGNE